eukprot:CAMPEP_0202978718 /NCGR_PEP_ID=MMETSP1396-20130829/85060_1 /ASSEMBLY_ACC=CAM_ASM_000872 /TAXON_ID= /ORGANISM="Pseudokeronopsis sp., Strain Brazil" /LENGTH=190 /DNA_ID=CAMNT_0049717805 /DNA_START=117 /DNA_END=689 /DNA_ORIENTATION=+
MDKFLRRVLPAPIVEKIRHAFLFRPEDPNKLLQITPPNWPHPTIARIKGFRTPSPGSQPMPSVPARESSDRIYDINYYYRDPRNLKTGNVVMYNSTTNTEKLIAGDKPNLPTAYKRKITPLPYDPTGLRTTKTTNWAAVEAELVKIVPDHLPEPVWMKESSDEMNEGLPGAAGKRYKYKEVSSNYNVVRW